MGEDFILVKKNAGVMEKLRSVFSRKQIPAPPDYSHGHAKAIAWTDHYRSTVNRDLGLVKEDQGISFETLRRISRYDTVVRLSINLIKKGVCQSPWSIARRPGVETIDPVEAEEARVFFSTMNHEGENLRMILDKVVEDILVLDAGVIEKIYNYEGDIVALNSVDGASIRPCINQYGEYGDPAYIQMIDESKVAEFSFDELIYIMQNPQNDVKRFGYGMSVLENMLIVIQASLNADLHNAEQFSKDNVPSGFIHLGNIMEHEAEAIKAVWDAETIGNTHTMRFLYGPNPPTFVPFQSSNKDMQYTEYIEWLTRIKLAAFGLSSMDANITNDVNKATARELTKLSNSRGVKSMKSLLEECLNQQVVYEKWKTIKFEFQRVVDLDEEKSRAQIDQIYTEKTGIMTINEVRERMGMKERASVFDETERIPEEEVKQETKKHVYPTLY